MKYSLDTLSDRLSALALFRGVLETDVTAKLLKLIGAARDKNPGDFYGLWGSFTSALYAEGGDLGLFVKESVLNDKNPYITSRLKGEPVPPAMEHALDAELDVLSAVTEITPESILPSAKEAGLPGWDTTPCSLRSAYDEMLSTLSTLGFGLYRKYHAFKVKDGKIVPIKHPDHQSLDSLYGYQRERAKILANTEGFARGLPASNVLLYGDAGTGKSSTIKACAWACHDKGVRLVEFDKRELRNMPDVIERLSYLPLKFIFYIDDLSFSAGDDSFCELKGILEGSAATKRENAVIYATSNRRHLVQETMESRMGSDIHLSDTLQETMSLSARFGLTVTFSKPEKDTYLDIVRNLAREYDVEIDDDELCTKAEAFAIRSQGRSPRTAKQFVQLLKVGI